MNDEQGKKHTKLVIPLLNVVVYVQTQPDKSKEISEYTPRQLRRGLLKSRSRPGGDWTC